jgi:hypothetical protein
MVADLSKRCSCFGVGSEEVCQVSSVKLITEFPPRGTPNSVLYDMANLRSLNMRRNDSFLIFIYKIIHGIILPSCYPKFISICLGQILDLVVFLCSEVVLFTVLFFTTAL